MAVPHDVSVRMVPYEEPMTRRPLSIPIATAVLLALAACSGPTVSPSSSAALTPTPEPSSAAPSASPTPSPAPTETAAASFDDESGFGVAPNPDADALFVARASCQALEQSFRLEYPEPWFTNDPDDEAAACAWFAPVAFEVDDPEVRPDAVAITIEIVPEDVFGPADGPSLEEGIVGETQNAVRIEEGGTYTYLVQLGPPGEGPTLVAMTSEDFGGDYELNKAVLDRMIATMEFIGSVG